METTSNTPARTASFCVRSRLAANLAARPTPAAPDAKSVEFTRTDRSGLLYVSRPSTRRPHNVTIKPTAPTSRSYLPGSPSELVVIRIQA